MLRCRAASLSFLGAAIALVVLSAGPACGAPDCTPEEHGLDGAVLLTVRPLPGVSTPEACTKPRIELIRSEADLRRLYEELVVASSDAGGGAEIEVPSVDFSRERVIVREGRSGEGITWAVARGETVTVGLLSCRGVRATSCAVDVIAVPAPVERVEARTCEPVGCGAPRPTRTRQR